ncbi:ABC transporter ATP-binding protein [Gemella haemolysans]|uniref:ABC transporter ATP-binding protein n=1 Tax=Gemella haemolysans TaxID=1379 RepID=UPI0029095F67|nr:ABC transporter ATP-binding protein [Gemella haemolysans]MDU3831604.1 ABC transporter ATP-binding protein [Gemella haemolysans]
MIKNILEVISLNKLKLCIMFILTLIVSIGTVYVVYARVDIVDSVIYKTGSLWTKVGVIICILIIVELLRAWLKIIIAQLVKQWKIYLGDRISKNIETMSQSEFNKVDSGEHMTKYTYQLELLSAYLFSPLTGLLSAIVLFISSVVFLWIINWKFVVFALLSSIAMFLISGKFGNKISVGYTNLSILSGKFSGVLKEYLTGYEDLKNIGKINLFSKNVKASQVQKEDKQYSISKLMAFAELTLQSIEKLLELLIFIFAIYLVLKNELTIGTIASVSTILGIYLTSINQLVDLYIKVIGTKEILNSVITKATAKETIYPHVEENIEFKNFNYSFGDNHVIKNFNFNINKGGKYAVIGKSGSGKSTIIKLLLGKLQSNQDKVLIDGNPLEIKDDINFSKEIGYVSQQTSIFSGSIRYNITLDDSYSDEEIWNTLEKVCLADRVKSLPDGLDHNLSNMGEILSGGEKQRLVLARVLIRNYPILILDEATSALDEKTAVQIENNILADDKLTLIMISHHIQEEIKKQLTECVELKVQ